MSNQKYKTIVSVVIAMLLSIGCSSDHPEELDASTPERDAAVVVEDDRAWTWTCEEGCEFDSPLRYQDMVEADEVDDTVTLSRSACMGCSAIVLNGYASGSTIDPWAGSGLVQHSTDMATRAVRVTYEGSPGTVGIVKTWVARTMVTTCAT